MILIIIIWYLIGLAKLIIGVEKYVRFHREACLPRLNKPKHLLVFCAEVIMLLAHLAIFLTIIWPFVNYSDEKIREMIEEKRKRLIKNNEL